jgi:hypothetical protein
MHFYSNRLKGEKQVKHPSELHLLQFLSQGKHFPFEL